jgi:16S rRNA (adenine1518-N6/adenine1519-N6)-dimethyltransferase
MNSPREIINHYAIKPRKSMGQSFLMEQNVIERIASIANVTENDIVVEIGAGIGVLTEYLAQKAAKLVAVELDDQLVRVLEDRLSKYDNVQIYHGNILRFDFREVAGSENRKIKIVGNIPYNISSPVLFYLLSFRDVINSFVLMMQKEVVQRLVAAPGYKSYGVPSVILQMFADVEKVLDVPASNFYPRPKVESSVIKGMFLERSLIELTNEEFFIKLVRDSFAQRRKILINNLKQSKLLEGVSEFIIKEKLILAGIDPQRRGETLSVTEFGCLSNILSNAIEK